VLADTYAGWRGSLPEEVWRERLVGCLAAAQQPADVLARNFVPGVLGESAPDELRAAFAAIVEDFHPIGFRAMSMSSAEVDTRDLLPNIDVPTLLLWGRDDRRSPQAVAEQFRDAIPNATLVTIQNAGHLSNMEQPGQFNEHVRRFCLSALPTGPAESAESQA
jgi:pimeloyl-ACP methyl ester carboxylesterase